MRERERDHFFMWEKYGLTRRGNNKFIEKQIGRRRENDGGSVTKVENNGEREINWR